MPWKETHAVLERNHLVDLVVHNGIAISQAARSLGISRKTLGGDETKVGGEQGDRE